jgi:hypothetical protein
MNENKVVMTLADVSSLVERPGVTGTRRRDMVSALKRLCEMAALRRPGCPRCLPEYGRCCLGFDPPPTVSPPRATRT